MSQVDCSAPILDVIVFYECESLQVNKTLLLMEANFLQLFFRFSWTLKLAKYFTVRGRITGINARDGRAI